jgi:oxalate decarboxylase/phosphoglucose isomerase-like protein (cupin superfamily)
MEHPSTIRPEQHAIFSDEKMGKATIFKSDRIMVGLNCFEPGQEHKLHAHEGMDKVYHVLEGNGLFVLEDEELRHPQQQQRAPGGARRARPRAGLSRGQRSGPRAEPSTC